METINKIDNSNIEIVREVKQKINKEQLTKQKEIMLLNIAKIDKLLLEFDK
jgi:hypothetical protein